MGRKTKKNPDGMVWAAECKQCGILTRQTNCEVDHLIPSGSLRTIDDIKPFVERLAFINDDDLEIVCKPCHRIRSYADRMGISFKEASIRKKIISLKNRNSQIEFLEKHGLYASPKSNSKDRLKLIEQYLREMEN